MKIKSIRLDSNLKGHIRPPNAQLIDLLEIPRPGRATNSAIEGLRGVAILLVFFVHYSEFIRLDANSSSTTLWLHGFLYRAGMSGVDLFFLISGYLIYGSIIRAPIDPLVYTMRRIKRIYPVFLFVLSIYIILSIAIPSRSKLSGDITADTTLVLLNVTLLPLVPLLWGTKPIISATWSLAYEVLYYLTAPLCVYALSFRTWNDTMKIVLIAGASAFGFVLFDLLGGNNRTMMFLSGVLLFELIRQYPNLRLPPWTGACALVLGITMLGLSEKEAGFPAVPLFILFNIACLDGFNQSSGFNTVLSSRPLRWLGNISYSFYLIHGLLLQGFLIAAQKIIPSASFFILILPALCVSVAGSFLVYTAIEKPFSLKNGRSAAAKATTNQS